MVILEHLSKASSSTFWNHDKCSRQIDEILILHFSINVLNYALQK